MTFSGVTLRGSEGSTRWLLLASLALNLFFIGVGGALLLQGFGSGTFAPRAAYDRSVAGRIERIAAVLPPADADRLRKAYKERQSEIDGARGAYRDKQEAVRAALRAQPFNLETLNTAMAGMRAARQAFDLSIHGFFAQQASEMSEAGRQALADRSRTRPGASQPSKN
jgi:uncharacterized membrane protein